MLCRRLQFCLHLQRAIDLPVSDCAWGAVKTGRKVGERRIEACNATPPVHISLMTDFLLLAFIFLIAGVISVPIASRLGLGSVLGYLIAGILISPILALLGVDVVSIQHFAEFGVVMMLFLVGLELEPEHLWGMRNQLLGLGGGQIILTTLAVMGVAILMGNFWTISLAIGLVVALSSTAIVLQTISVEGQVVIEHRINLRELRTK